MPTVKNPMIDFAHELIKRAGLDNMPEDFKAEQAEQIAFEAQRRLALVAEKDLTAEALDEYYKMVEKNQARPEEILEFFKNNIENFEPKMQDALRQFADEFLSGAEKLKKASV